MRWLGMSNSNGDSDLLRQAQADTLTTAAASIESALVALFSSFLADSDLDTELETLKHNLRVDAHGLRRVAFRLTRGK